MKAIYILSTMMLCLFALLAACKPVKSVEEVMFAGTVRGLEACFSSQDNSVFSEDELRRFCADKHEDRLDENTIWLIDGRALITDQGFSVKLSNGIADVLLTQITLEAEIFDKAGKGTKYYATKNLWVLSGEAAEFSADFQNERPEEAARKNFCEKEAPKDCKRWTIVRVQGITY